jgi:transcriptional regulator with XRE-family HTH domain
VQAWERNERNPRPKTLTQISRVLDQPVTFFFTDRDVLAEDADEPSGAVA